MPGRTVHRGRLLFVLFVVCAIALAAVLRTAQWQVLERGRLVALAEQQTTIRVEEPMQRGTIYDRTGTVVLASTVERDRLVGSPSQLGPAERASVAGSLIAVLGLTGADAATLQDRFTTDSSYVVLRDGLDGPTADKVRAALADGSIAAVSLEKEPIRVYPQAGGGKDSTLAAQLLGFVNGDGEGQYGVESYYQDALAGSPRVLLTGRDVNDRPMWDTARVEQPGVAGSDIRLTIDASLQLRLEQQVFAAWVADHAASVSGIVLDPLTGEVLAEATYPSYDGNAYRSVAGTDPSLFLDPNVSAVYEPGSVAKMFLASAAYERDVVKPTTKINDSGVLKVANGTVYDADHKPMGLIAFRDVVAYSRNVGVSRVALRLGKTTAESATALYDTWTKYGLGSRTGIDVAGEVDGLVNDPGVRPWTQLDLANGVVRAGRGRHADAARGRVRGDGERRVQGDAAGRRVDRRPRAAEAAAGADHPGRAERPARLAHAARRHGRGLLPREDGDPQLPRRRQDRHRGDLGPEAQRRAGRLPPERLQLLVRRLRRAVEAAGGHRAHDPRRPPDRVRPGRSMDLPIQSFDLFRRIAQDSIAMLGIAPRTPGGEPSASPARAPPGSPGASATPGRFRLADRSAVPAGVVRRRSPAIVTAGGIDVGPGARGARRRDAAAGATTAAVSGSCATLPAVTDAGTPHGPRGDRRAAFDADGLAAATGGTLLVDGDRPIHGAAVDSRRVTDGAMFVALPGERTDGHDHVPAAVAAGAAAIVVTREPGPAARAAIDDAPGGRHGDPRHRWHRSPAGGCRRLADAVHAAHGRHHGERREDLDEGGGRRRPGGRACARCGAPATRTTRSASRSRSSGWTRTWRRPSSRWACTEAARSRRSRGSASRRSAW